MTNPFSETAFYDPTQVLSAIDANTVPFLLLFSLCMIGAVTWYIVSIRVARRDQLVSIPFICTVTWLPHDTSFLFLMGEWIELGHWFPIGFSAMMIIFVGIELVWLSQMIKYGHKEYAPTTDQRIFAIGCVALIFMAGAAWFLLKSALNDPLYLVSMYLTIAYCPAAAIAIAWRRGSRQGQSILQWVGFMLMTVAYAIGSGLWWGEAFRSWPWVVYGIAVSASGLAVIAVLLRLPETQAVTNE